MPRAGNLHSRLVRWLKVILPLTALAILSTLFLVARTIDPQDAIPYAQVDVEDRVREPRVTQPTWSGMTDDGAALTIQAAEARPGDAGTENAGTATDVTGHLETPDGRSADMTAATARMDGAAGRMVLGGGVTVTTSTGYRAEMPELATALRQTDVESAGGEVTATGPLGKLRADHMRLTQGENGYLLVFNGGVRLIYQPPK
ncbi:MAG: hypothetical protein QM656_10495 [Paracoccaceae bacterium]